MFSGFLHLDLYFCSFPLLLGPRVLGWGVGGVALFTISPLAVAEHVEFLWNPCFFDIRICCLDLLRRLVQSS